MQEGGPHFGSRIGAPHRYPRLLRPLFQRFGIRLAYLFGSQAIGHTGPLSDIDLAILWPEDERLPMLASMKLQQAIRDRLQDERIEVGPLNTQGIGFCFQVIRDGLLLYGTERDRVRFETKVLNEHHDFQYWDELHEQALQRAILRTAVGNGRPR